MAIYFSAAFGSLRSILIVDLIGLEKLTNGFGLLLLFQGIATVIGSPIAGKCCYHNWAIKIKILYTYNIYIHILNFFH